MEGQHPDKKAHTSTIKIEASEDATDKDIDLKDTPDNAAAFNKAICGARATTTQRR